MVAAAGVIPVLTPAEMAGVDRQASEPVEVLVERAGFAVAGAARRHAGRQLRAAGRRGGRARQQRGGRARRRPRAGAQGAAVSVFDAGDVAGRRPAGPSDLVIDAAYGTGLSRPYASARSRFGAPVLAVDIPSGCPA